MQKEAAVEIGALLVFGAVDDQLPRRRKAAVEIGAPFHRCRRSAQDEEEKPPSSLAHRFAVVEDQYRIRKEGRR